MSAIATLLTNESYLPGALTLAHTLRSLGTQYPVVVLLDETQVSDRSLQLLEAAYDRIIPISDRLVTSPVDDRLGRPELAVTFSKLLLWNESYDQILYLDTDVLPLANVDHLFDEGAALTPRQIAASPDSGWPDIFNSGVLLFKPDPQVYSDLVEFASGSDSSFDGADQGLLNEFFAGNWHRLPFLYNVTPTESYQYVPAFHRFFKDIKILHYIGQIKPWHSSTNIDHFRFHHLWWDRFSEFFDKETKNHILGATGEASRLQIPHYSNTWDSTESAPPLSSSYAEPAPAGSLPAVFPWEQRQTGNPTRVFDSGWGRESEGEVAAPAKLARPSATDNIETSMQAMKVGTGKPSGLKKKYEFSSRNELSDFNPEESLERVTQLPAKLMSKFKK